MVFCMAYFFTTFQSASLNYCSLFVESDPKDVVIQGSRVSVSSPWTTDDGQPLPFVGEFQGISNLAGTLRIIFTSSGKWANVNPTNVFPNAVCEIPVWDSKWDIFHSPKLWKVNSIFPESAKIYNKYFKVLLCVLIELFYFIIPLWTFSM